MVRECPAELSDHLVDSRLPLHDGIAPERMAKLLACHQTATAPHQEAQGTRRLRAQRHRCSVAPAELAGLEVEPIGTETDRLAASVWR
jgi:hypothetical protein